MNTELDFQPPVEAEEEFEIPAEPPRRRLGWVKWLLIPLAFVLGIGAGYAIFALPLQNQLSAANAQIAKLNAAAGQEQAAAQQPVKRYTIPVEGFPTFGNKNAPITIVEFSDYECTYCQQWHLQVWPEIVKKYGDQVRLVYRDFPLFGLHNNAEPTAVAAHCADEQGKYWEYHDTIFSGKYPLNRQSYEAMAISLKLDSSKFAACLDSGRYLDVVKSNYDFASKLGVQSTPTFFVNGLALVGAQPFEVFDKVIQMEIKGEIPAN
jgi:protein-disulfide isomerase